MKLQRWLKMLAAGVGGLLLLLTLTLLLLPSRELVGVVQRVLAQQGMQLDVGQVSKAFPLGLSAQQVMLSSNQGTMLTADRLVCRFHLLPLLVGRRQWSVDATIGSGSLRLGGTIGKRAHLTIASSNLRLEKLPILKTALGGSVQGTLGINGTLTGTGPAVKGTLQLEAAAIDLRDVSLGGLRLPNSLYRTMRGQLNVANGTVTLQSLALDGEGIYARLKGTFPVTTPPTAAPLSLTLELMPKPEFMERQKLIFLLLARFMSSPGNFQIPVKGTLGAPSVL